MTAEAYIQQRITVDDFGCWLWPGYKNQNGYGYSKLNKIRKLAHRFSYETYKGSIPEKYQIDHICHNANCTKTSDCQHRSCVNPEHLEAVTSKVNIARSNHASKKMKERTKCIRGHEYTKVNTYLARKDGQVVGRVCKACHREYAYKRFKRLGKGK